MGDIIHSVLLHIRHFRIDYYWILESLASCSVHAIIISDHVWVFMEITSQYRHRLYGWTLILLL